MHAKYRSLLLGFVIPLGVILLGVGLGLYTKANSEYAGRCVADRLTLDSILSANVDQIICVIAEYSPQVKQALHGFYLKSDNIYALCYGPALALMLLWLLLRPAFPRLALLILAMPLAGAALDLIENHNILILLDAPGGALPEGSLKALTLSTSAKWLCLIPCIPLAVITLLHATCTCWRLLRGHLGRQRVSL